MKVTELRPLKPGDKEKADEVVRAATAAAEKYEDYTIALADGYKIFLPDLPQKQYHFTNYRYAWQARNHFDPRWKILSPSLWLDGPCVSVRAEAERYLVGGAPGTPSPRLRYSGGEPINSTRLWPDHDLTRARR